MHRPEVRSKEFSGIVFAIPVQPMYNEHGFVILPVVPGQEPRKRCHICGQHCRPDVHHAYWPKPVRTEAQRADRAKFTRFDNALDYTRDPYRALRVASFAMSDPICSRWHAALHAVQLPPSEAPDPDIIRAALDQQDRLDRAQVRANNLQLVSSKQRPNIKHLTSELKSAEAIQADMPDPKAILFPTHGYLCVVDSETPFQSNVVSYDLHSVYSGIDRAINLAKARLS